MHESLTDTWGLISSVAMTIFWIILVLFLVFWVKRWLEGPAALQQDSQLEVLKKRYARGEITKKEFEEKKDSLL